MYDVLLHAMAHMRWQHGQREHQSTDFTECGTLRRWVDSWGPSIASRKRAQVKVRPRLFVNGNNRKLTKAREETQHDARMIYHYLHLHNVTGFECLSPTLVFTVVLHRNGL